MATPPAASTVSIGDMFVKTTLTDRVKVRPRDLGIDLKAHLTQKLATRFEGKCSYHGFVRPGSIEIERIAPGVVVDYSLNGDVEYSVTYRADLCNPVVGAIVVATVVNTNRFGILAECSVAIRNDDKLPVIDVVIPKEILAEDVENVKPGDVVHAEVVGRKYDIGDRRISVVGKLVRSKDGSLMVTPAGDVSVPEEMESEYDEDGDNGDEGEGESEETEEDDDASDKEDDEDAQGETSDMSEDSDGDDDAMDEDIDDDGDDDDSGDDDSGEADDT